MDELRGLIDEDSVARELKRFQKSLQVRLLLRRPWTNKDVQQTVQHVFQPPPRRVHSKHVRSCSFRVIFAILVRMERVGDLRRFIKNDVCDEHLPLTPMPRRDGRPRLGSELRPRETLDCLRKWDLARLRRFEEVQWSMLAPFFAKDKEDEAQHYTLQPEVILPFTEWKLVQRTSGSGEVFKARIHPEHHGFSSPNQEEGLLVAIKRLKTTSKDKFRHEVEILRRLSRSHHEHPHLTTLLVTYEQYERFHIMLPWAEADLLGYWRDRNPDPMPDRKTSLWLAQQCHGIAEGLEKIHKYLTFDHSDSIVYTRSSNASAPPSEDGGSRPRSRSGSVDSTCSRRLYGRHGDIKPENILWYPELGGEQGMGVLKISDFGITEFTVENATSRRERGWMPNSPSYRPPEFDLEHGEISGYCDVWTLGCLYLEFAAWLMGGWRYVHDFALSRRSPDAGLAGVESDTFFVIHKTEDLASSRASVKPRVMEFVQELQNDARCTWHLREFLRLIMDFMVVVDTPAQSPALGNGEQARAKRLRRTCHTISFALSEIYEKCRNEPGYTFNG